MSDAKPNAIEMLALLPDVDAFMLEVSRAISEKPWPHHGPQTFPTGPYTFGDCCGGCGAPWPPECKSCSAPPRLTESPEWWAFRLKRKAINECPAQLGQTVVTFWDKLYRGQRVENSSDWLAYWANPQEIIAISLVALGLWGLK